MAFRGSNCSLTGITGQFGSHLVAARQRLSGTRDCQTSRHVQHRTNHSHIIGFAYRDAHDSEVRLFLHYGDLTARSSLRRILPSSAHLRTCGRSMKAHAERLLLRGEVRMCGLHWQGTRFSRSGTRSRGIRNGHCCSSTTPARTRDTSSTWALVLYVLYLTYLTQ